MDPSKNPWKNPRLESDEPAVAESVADSEGTPAFLDELAENEVSRDKFGPGIRAEEDQQATGVPRYDERDYQSHRRESFPHPHQPLKPIRSFRRKISRSVSEDSASRQAETVLCSSPTLEDRPQLSRVGRVQEENSDPEGDLSCELLDDGLGSPSQSREYSKFFAEDYGEMMTGYEKKVQFEIGGTSFEPVLEDEPTEKKKYKSHYRSFKYEDPQWRLRMGSEVREDHSEVPLLFKDAEINDMADLDKDDLTTHRFGDAKGFRRHKFYFRGPEAIAAAAIARTGAAKYNHQPHEVFVELDVLTGLGEEREWKETARWIKYEEDVEEGADRWGRPHVASLSFHSLINLRRLIEAGVVLLDLEERDLPGVAYRVVDQMVVKELVEPENKGMVMRALLLKHRHVQDSEKNWKFPLKRGAGSSTSLSNSIDEKKASVKGISIPLMELQGSPRRNSTTFTVPVSGKSSENGISGKRNGSHPGSFNVTDNQQVLVDLSKVAGVHVSEEDLRVYSNKESILRRIPVGAEASVVLVGNDEALEGPAMAFVRLAESVYMPNITEVPIPVRFIFILLGPTSFELDYTEIGRSIATLMSNQEFHAIAYKADDSKDLLKGIHEYLDQSIVLPPGQYEEDVFSISDLNEKQEALRLRKEIRSNIRKGSLVGGGSKQFLNETSMDVTTDLTDFEGAPVPARPSRKSLRLFNGLYSDIRRRYPLYLSDIRDGLNFQCIAAIVFIAFAQICGSITFGGLMSKKTGDEIGITETILTSGIGGLIFALLSGQPMLIVGTTGPLLLFDDNLYEFAKDKNVPFLPLRTWIGLWLFLIATVFVALDGSKLVKYFTRFTQEIFSSYISLLFLLESLLNLAEIYRKHPFMRSYDETLSSKPNTFLLSGMLMFGTFGIAWFFRNFRSSQFLVKWVRNILENFAVPIAIFTMVFFDFVVKDVETEKLVPPKGFHPSSNRTWIISYEDVQVELWMPVAASLPALLLFLLLFMETLIGESIMSKPDYRLKKGSGYHLDLLLICGINSLISFAGLPWISIALVRAVSHASALTVWSTNNPPGEKPVITGVREQRVTACMVSILTAGSLAMATLLENVPLAVLYGVFLFMGISSLINVQLVERFKLFFKQVEHHPQVPYVRRVKTWKMHLYTLIQCLWLGLLWGLKYTTIALGFPFVLIMLIPFRFFALKLVFKAEELNALDGTSVEKKDGGIPPGSLKTGTARDSFKRDSFQFPKKIPSMFENFPGFHDTAEYHKATSKQQKFTTLNGANHKQA